MLANTSRAVLELTPTDQNHDATSGQTDGDGAPADGDGTLGDRYGDGDNQPVIDQFTINDSVTPSPIEAAGPINLHVMALGCQPRLRPTVGARLVAGWLMLGRIMTGDQREQREHDERLLGVASAVVASCRGAPAACDP